MRKVKQAISDLFRDLNNLSTAVWLWSAGGGVVAYATSTYLTAPGWAVFLSILLAVFILPNLFLAWRSLKTWGTPDTPSLHIKDPKLQNNIPGENEQDYLFSVIVCSWNTVDPISGVIVALEEFTGGESSSYINQPFEFKAPYSGNSQVTCNRGEKVTVHILWYRASKQKFLMCFQGSNRPALQGLGPYVVRLRATGGGANPDYKSYRIGLRDGVPFMEAIV